MIAHEIAELAEVNTNIVRYYSRIGLLNPSRNPAIPQMVIGNIRPVTPNVFTSSGRRSG